MPRTSQKPNSVFSNRVYLQIPRIVRKSCPVQTGVKNPNRLRNRVAKEYATHGIYKMMLTNLQPNQNQPKFLNLIQKARKLYQKLHIVQSNHSALALQKLNKIQSKISKKIKISYQDKTYLNQIIPTQDVIRADLLTIQQFAEFEPQLQEQIKMSTQTYTFEASKLRFDSQIISNQLQEGQTLLQNEQIQFSTSLNSLSFQFYELIDILDNLKKMVVKYQKKQSSMQILASENVNQDDSQ